MYQSTSLGEMFYHSRSGYVPTQPFGTPPTGSEAVTPGLHPCARPAVGILQSLLRARGFNPGPQDSVFGPQTRSAMQAFQRQTSVGVTDLPNSATLSVLGLLPGRDEEFISASRSSAQCLAAQSSTETPGAPGAPAPQPGVPASGGGFRLPWYGWVGAAALAATGVAVVVGIAAAAK